MSFKLLVTADQTAAAARTGTALQALMAAMLGMVLLFGVGFAPLAALHNAAHDTRHSAAFPCH
ncbi:MAG: CbtB-domain containing protein [Geminicoccaceae bacterium]